MDEEIAVRFTGTTAPQDRAPSNGPLIGPDARTCHAFQSPHAHLCSHARRATRFSSSAPARPSSPRPSRNPHPHTHSPVFTTT